MKERATLCSADLTMRQALATSLSVILCNCHCIKGDHSGAEGSP